MHAKPLKKTDFVKTKPLRRKPLKSKDFFSKEPEFLTTFGNDAETIRKEVMRVKTRLKHSPRLFEKMGAIGRPKFKKD
jgi:hypothetical protein